MTYKLLKKLKALFCELAASILCGLHVHGTPAPFKAEM